MRYPTIEHGATFFEDLLERARLTPGTVSVALSDTAPPPLASGRALSGSRVEGRPVDSKASAPIHFRSVTPQYFETFRIGVVRERTFQDADVTGEPAVVLNESGERLLFPGERALGRRIRFPTPPAFGTVPRP